MGIEMPLLDTIVLLLSLQVGFLFFIFLFLLAILVGKR